MHQFCAKVYRRCFKFQMLQLFCWHVENQWTLCMSVAFCNLAAVTHQRQTSSGSFSFFGLSTLTIISPVTDSLHISKRGL